MVVKHSPLPDRRVLLDAADGGAAERADKAFKMDGVIAGRDAAKCLFTSKIS
jgi:hypothetical protein